MSAGITAFLDAPTWAIFGFGLSSVCIALGLLIGWQNFHIQRANKVNIDQGEEQKGKVSSIKPFPIQGFMSVSTAVHEWDKAFPRYFILERARQEKEGLIINNPDRSIDLLKRIAKHIAGTLPIYGRNRHSGVFEKINNIEWFAFNDDLTEMNHKLYDNSPGGKYIELGVRQEEFAAFLEAEGTNDSDNDLTIRA